MSTYSSWLDKDFSLPQEMIKKIKNIQNEDTSAHTMRGRPCKSFGECSLRSKRNKIKNLLNMQSSEEICMAVEMSLQASGKRDL